MTDESFVVFEPMPLEPLLTIETELSPELRRFAQIEDGDLVRAEGRPETYVIENGARRLVPDEATLTEWQQARSVKIRALPTVYEIPLGEPIASVITGFTSERDRIRSYIASLPLLAPVPEYTTAKVLPDLTRSVRGVDYTFRSQQVQLARKFEDIAFLDPPQDVYPGALLQARVLGDHSIAPILFARAGGTITVATDLIGGQITTRSVPVAEASHPIVNQARVDLLAQINPRASAGAWQTHLTTARTEAHGLIKVGLAVNTGKLSLDANVKYASQEETSTVMFRLRQIYYTMTFEPEMAGALPAFFDETVALADVQSVCTPSNPPCYVSQASYGRELLIVATGNMRKTDLELGIKGKVGESISGNFTGQWDNLLRSTTVQVVQRGGPGMASQLVFLADPVNDLTAYIEQGKNFSLENPGTLISFQARYLSNNQLVRVGAITDYTEVVSVSAENAVGSAIVRDGPGALRRVPVRDAAGRDVIIRRNDYVELTAEGEVWAGVVLTGKHGPDGWPGWTAPQGYPLPGADSFSLIAGFDGSGWDGWFQVGSATSFVYDGQAGEAVRLFLALNDNNVTNGGGAFGVVVKVGRPDAIHEYPGGGSTA